MQTFLPEGRDFPEGFIHLDRMRLGKQRVEAWQILNVLRGVDNDGNPKNHRGWVSHPATLMWQGYEIALARYGMACSTEWKRRGYNDTMWERFLGVRDLLANAGYDPRTPPWCDDDDLVRSHRSNLIRKMPDHYQPLWPDVPNDLPYVWPSPSQNRRMPLAHS